MTRTSGTDGAVVRVPAASEGVAEAVRDVATDARVVEVGATGVRGLDPLVTLTRGGTTAIHAAVSTERARELVAALENAGPDGDRLGEGAHAVVEHESDWRTLPVPGTGPLSVGRRRVLGRCGWVDPTDASAYETFVADAANEDPEAVREQIRELGLRGRGRGDASANVPIVEEWEVAHEVPGDPVVVVNGNEADRRNETDRVLLEGDPISVVDGALAAAAAVDAREVVVYLNESDDLARRRIEAAVAAVENALETTTSDAPYPSVEVVVGPDRYVAGEPTMALEAMEGADRLEARLRPPGPARYGLYGRPTVIHTPRTLSQVREALRRPEAFDPDDADPGTRSVTVAGDVVAPATVELPTSGSLTVVRGAVEMEGRFKMACVGGQFGGLTRTLDHAPAGPALASAGLGTDGVVELLNEERCPVATAGTRTRFAAEENCGRCVPCREGSTQLTGLLRAVYDGTYDGAGIRELARVMGATSTCAFGRDAARPVVTAIGEFETEFRAHADGRCPSGACGGHA